MKKSLRFLCVAALAMAAAFSSCQKQDMELPSEESVSSEATRASSFSSKYGIDWDNIAVIRPGSEYTAISSLRATSDKNYLYLLVKVDASQLSSGSTHHYDNFLSVYLYDSNGSSAGDWKEGPVSRVDNLCGWLVKDRKPYFTYWGDGVNRQVVEVSGTYYYEIRYPRSLSSLLSKSSVWLGVTLSNRYYRNDGSYSSQNSIIGRVPSKGKALYWLSMSSNGSTSNNDTPSNSGDSNHCSDIGKTPMVMAYVPAYSSCPSSSDAARLTHINFFGYTTDSNGNVYQNESGGATISAVMKLKDSNSNLKVLLTIGGASGASNFSKMANSSSARKQFCEDCSYLVSKYRFDGIDLDWEHPDGSTDRANFNTLLKELRSKLGSSKIISAAVSSNPSHYDWSGAMKYLDYVNVMTYDMNWPSSSAQYTSHHSALYKSSSSKNPASKSASAAAKAYKDAGVPINKQNLGVAFYGHGTKNYDPDKDGVAFRKISSTVIDNSKWDDAAMVPYYYKSSSDYLGYENEKSVNLKGQYAKLNGFLGVMIWEYGHDKDGKLLKALSRGMRGEDRYGDPSSKTKSDLPLYK